MITSQIRRRSDRDLINMNAKIELFKSKLRSALQSAAEIQDLQ